MEPASHPSDPTSATPIGGGATARRVLRCVPLLAVALATAFLALRPEPSLRDVHLVPRALVRFFDGHDFFNNVVGFGVLAAAVHFAFARLADERRRTVVVRMAAVAAAVVALEGAQWWMPARSCDWRDVVAGWLGILFCSTPWLFFRGKNRPS